MLKYRSIAKVAVTCMEIRNAMKMRGSCFVRWHHQCVYSRCRSIAKIPVYRPVQ